MKPVSDGVPRGYDGTSHPPARVNTSVPHYKTKVSSRLEAFASRLVIPEGPLAGRPMEVLPWEADLFAMMDTPGDVAVSMARGNGKTAGAAALACAAVDPDGPLHQPRGLCVIIASSFKQAGLAFGDVTRFLFPDRLPRAHDPVWRILDNQNVRRIEHRATGAAVEAYAANPQRAHGLRPSLVILDEPSQWPRTTRDAMLAAMRTAAGKLEGCRIVAIGTRPADPAHWFEGMLRADRAICYAAPKDADPLDESAWRAANPSLDHLPVLRAAIAREAKLAEQDPALLASFRALRLNAGVSEVLESLIVSVDSWKRAEADVPSKGSYVLGVDLSGGVAVSACAAYWPKGGRLDAFGAFPVQPNLHERGLRDGVGDLYIRQAERGELLTLGNRTVDYSALIAEAVARWGQPVAVVCDDFRYKELRDALDVAGVRARPVLRKRWSHASEDLRLFRRAILERTARPVVSLLLRSAIADARAHPDTHGNERMASRAQSGRRQEARDDAVAASLLAVAHGRRMAASGRLSRPKPQLLVCG